MSQDDPETWWGLLQTAYISRQPLSAEIEGVSEETYREVSPLPSTNISCEPYSRRVHPIKYNWAKSAGGIIECFGGFSTRTLPNPNSPRNTMMLESAVHILFDSLNLWLTPFEVDLVPIFFTVGLSPYLGYRTVMEKLSLTSTRSILIKRCGTHSSAPAVRGTPTDPTPKGTSYRGVTTDTVTECSRQTKQRHVGRLRFYSTYLPHIRSVQNSPWFAGLPYPFGLVVGDSPLVHRCQRSHTGPGLEQALRQVFRQPGTSSNGAPQRGFPQPSHTMRDA